MHPRDVTRHLVNGKMHLAIYVKPSLIRFSSSAITEQEVKASEIEPLLVRDITIRAKKKLDY